MNRKYAHANIDADYILTTDQLAPGKAYSVAFAQAETTAALAMATALKAMQTTAAGEVEAFSHAVASATAARDKRAATAVQSLSQKESLADNVWEKANATFLAAFWTQEAAAEVVAMSNMAADPYFDTSPAGLLADYLFYRATARSSWMSGAQGPRYQAFVGVVADAVYAASYSIAGERKAQADTIADAGAAAARPLASSTATSERAGAGAVEIYVRAVEPTALAYRQRIASLAEQELGNRAKLVCDLAKGTITAADRGIRLAEIDAFRDQARRSAADEYAAVEIRAAAARNTTLAKAEAALAESSIAALHAQVFSEIAAGQSAESRAIDIVFGELSQLAAAERDYAVDRARGIDNAFAALAVAHPSPYAIEEAAVADAARVREETLGPARFNRDVRIAQAERQRDIADSNTRVARERGDANATAARERERADADYDQAIARIQSDEQAARENAYSPILPGVAEASLVKAADVPVGILSGQTPPERDTFWRDQVEFQFPKMLQGQPVRQYMATSLFGRYAAEEDLRNRAIVAQAGQPAGWRERSRQSRALFARANTGIAIELLSHMEFVDSVGQGLKTGLKLHVNNTSNMLVHTFSMGLADDSAYNPWAVDEKDIELGYETADKFVRFGYGLMGSFALNATAIQGGLVGIAALGLDLGGNIVNGSQAIDSIALNGFNLQNSLQLAGSFAGLTGNAIAVGSRISKSFGKNTDQFCFSIRRSSDGSLSFVDEAADVLRACFAAGTRLLTPFGSKRIEEFNPGDVLITAPEDEPERRCCERPVEEIFRTVSPILELRIGGRTIRTTVEHPFWVKDRGWLYAGALEPGMLLRSHDGRWLPVQAIAGTDDVEMVYNVRVAEHHTYFVTGDDWDFSVWSHNANYAALATGNVGELAAVRWLEQQGYDILASIQSRAMKNASNHGIDLIAQKNGELFFFEVKSSLGPYAGPLRGGQTGILQFVTDRLAKAASGRGHWRSIDPAVRDFARELIDRMGTTAPRGFVISVEDMAGNRHISMSPWR